MLDRRKLAAKRNKRRLRRNRIRAAHRREEDTIMQGGEEGLRTIANRAKRKANIRRKHHLRKEDYNEIPDS